MSVYVDPKMSEGTVIASFIEDRGGSVYVHLDTREGGYMEFVFPTWIYREHAACFVVGATVKFADFSFQAFTSVAR